MASKSSSAKTRKQPAKRKTSALAKDVTPAGYGPEIIDTPVAVVSPEIAQAFGLNYLPETLVRIEEPTPASAPAAVTAPYIEPSASEGDAPRVGGAYKIHIEQGINKSELNRQWASRPADQRFTTFKELSAHVKQRRLHSRETLLDLSAIRGTGRGIEIQLNEHEEPLTLSNFSFNQLCDVARVPAHYLARLPDELAAANLAHGLSNHHSTQAIKALTYHAPGEPARLAAITTPTYGRIWDCDVVNVVQYLLAIDPTWKIPGEMNWHNMTHNPYVDITKDNTTLFASDRDCFMFFCKDDRPIECGKTARGDTDVYFPGCWFANSEQGDNRHAEMASMYLRGVCMNRNLWGVEQFKSVKLKHSKNAAATFQKETALLIRQLHEQNILPFVHLIAASREMVLAKSAEEATEFLKARKFTQAEVSGIIDVSVKEEEREPRTLFDFTQAITAYSRQIPNNNRRTAAERIGSDLLKLAA